MKKTHVLWLAMLCTVPGAFSQSASFTYQGRLSVNGVPAGGSNDLTFTLYSAASGGTTVGTSNVLNDVAISNGLFTVSLDFGAGAFDGSARWLEIAVRPGASTGAYTNLAPRQALTATPYAVRAANFSGAVADGQLSGNIPRLNAPAVFAGAVTFSNASGTFSGNGAGVTNVNLASGLGGGVTFEVGTAAFFLSSSPVVGSGPYSVVAADINGDGRPDLISANISSDTLSVLTNNGHGSFVFSSSPVVAFAPSSVAAGDINGDGKNDLIVGYDAGNTLTVLTNNGAGGFTVFSSLVVGNIPRCVAAADLNGDGKVDVVSANSGSNTLSVLTNNGSGGLVLASSPVVGTSPWFVITADMNGDGKVDLISADIGSQALSILTNKGGAGFVLASAPGVGIYPEAIAAADINGDGKLDLMVASDGSMMAVLTNRGGGGLVLSASLVVDDAGYGVAAADVNGDGHMDLICTRYGAGSLGLLTNDGSGGFTLSSSPVVGLGPLSIAVVDVNGDGRMDLVSANYGGGNTLSVLLSSRQLNGAFSGNGTGLSGVDAATLNGFKGGDFARLAADQIFTGQNVFNYDAFFNGPASFYGSYNYFSGSSTFNGNIAVGPGAVVSLGSQVRQMLNLWGVQYGLGVQSGTLYFRSDNSAADNGFAWYRGGTHSDTVKDPGASGSTLMTLDGNRLHVNAAVGLGTPNPAAKLHLYSTDNPTTFRIQSSGTPGFGRIEFVSNPQGDPSEWRPAYIQSLDAGGFTGGLGFYVNGSGNTFGSLEVMRLINGTVGIGASAPQQQLSVGAGMNIDQNDANAGTVANTLRFGSGSGEAIGSKRTPGGNRWGLDFYTGAANRMTILNNGNVGIGTIAPGALLQVGNATCNGTTWINASDRNLKENFEPVDGRKVLEKVAAMPIQSWCYTNDVTARHVGPMAQDFHAAFGLGTDNKHIATVDADGVALAAIQGLNQKVEVENHELRAALKTKDTEIAELKRGLAELRELIGKR